MKRTTKKSTDLKSLSALGLWVLAACGSQGGCNNEPPGTSQRSPYRDRWVTEVDQEFVHTDGEGTPLIFDFIVGGREENDNFANRGDIIVEFDGPPNRILVEMRRFTFAATEDAAEEDYDALQAWAYTSSPGRPQDQAPEDNCIKAADDPDQSWQQGCELRVYYDGQSQLKRSGADIRVTLPPDYKYKISAFTQDNIEEEDYLNRGNICMSGLYGTATLETESGKIWASLARNVQEAPKCTAEQIDKCENWTVEDDMGNVTPAPWAPECDCIAVGGGEFGRLEAKSREETAADIVIDIPEGLWASAKAENTGMGQSASGDHCDATIEVANFEPNETGNDSPWQAFGNVNYPGAPAIAGAGYSIVATSKSCEPVQYTEDPADFVGTGNGKEQTSEERGNVRICTDCVPQACDDLIP
jgi:hypothetical protein